MTKSNVSPADETKDLSFTSPTTSVSKKTTLSEKAKQQVHKMIKYCKAELEKASESPKEIEISITSTCNSSVKMAQTNLADTTNQLKLVKEYLNTNYQKHGTAMGNLFALVEKVKIHANNYYDNIQQEKENDKLNKLMNKYAKQVSSATPRKNVRNTV